MAIRKILFLTFSIILWAIISRGQVTNPPNIDFEYGNTTIWHFYTGTCCPISTPTETLALPRRHSLTVGADVDPYGLFPIVAPGGGTYSLKLGSDTSDYCAEKARYYVHVPSGTTNYSLIYRYAMVLQSGGHLAPGQPRFEVGAFDSLTGNLLPCAQFEYVANSVIPGFYTSSLSGYSNVMCRNWATAAIDLSGYAGRTVAIDFAAGSCGYGAHFGYGYIDMSCGLFAINTMACDSTTITLHGPFGFEHYTWFDSTDFTTVLDTNMDSHLSIPSTTKTFAVVLTPYSGFGCPDTLYTRVVPSRLVVSAHSNDTAICFTRGAEVPLFVEAHDIIYPLTYSWSPSMGLSCTGCSDPIAYPGGPTTFAFTVTDPAGCLHTDSIRITEYNMPSTTWIESEPCHGNAVGRAAIFPGIRSIPPFNYYWFTTPPQTRDTATALLAGTYSVVFTDSLGCRGWNTVTITEPPPNRIFISDSVNPTACLSPTGSFTISGFTPGSTDTIHYEVGSTYYEFPYTADASGNITISGLTAGVYSNISVVTTNCEFNRIRSVSLENPPSPPPPTTAVTFYCQFDTPGPVTAVGSNLRWYSYGAGGSTTAPIPNTSVPSIDSYSVTQTVLGCESLPATAWVIVKPQPDTPAVRDTAYCRFAPSVQLTAIGRDLRWYVNATIPIALSTAPTPSTDTTGTYTWYVTQSVDGCESIRKPIRVTVLDQPDFTIRATRDYVCQFDTLTLCYSGGQLINPIFTWTTALGDTVLAGSVRDSQLTIRFDTAYGQYIKLRVDEFNGMCHASDTLKVRVVQKPAATCSAKQTFCPGDTVVLALASSTTNVVNYNWNFDGGSIVGYSNTVSGPFMVSWQTPGLYTVSVTPKSIEGCTGDSYSEVLYVLDKPNSHFTVTSNTNNFCTLDSLHFVADDSVSFGNKYLWSPERDFYNMNLPSAWARVSRAGYVSLKVTSPLGCTATDSLLLTPGECCGIFIPNAFVPASNDALLRTFRPLFVDNAEKQLSMFTIFNRWGQLVFSGTRSTDGWDGVFNGEPQDAGVYYYLLQYDCNGKTIEKKGDVTLIR